MTDAALHREALRQQLLLGALRADARPGGLDGWLREAPPRAARGLQAYRANAGAQAERALAAAFPTVAQLVGEDSFASLARALWHAQPPQRGDLGGWGEALPAFVAAAPQLAGEPYLADVARLDWALHLADRAADPGTVSGLEHLAGHDPAALWLRLTEGLMLLNSAYPVASLWQAHRSDAADRFAPVREALAAGRGEHALVWRHGFRASVLALPEADASFVRALLDGRSLAAALDAAGAGFDFARWLAQALQHGWLQAVDLQPIADA
jgi:hypothetical protein